MSARNIIAFAAATLILAGCSDSGTKAEAPAPATASKPADTATESATTAKPVAPPVTQNAAPSATKAELVKQQDALRPRYTELRLAYIAIRDPLREKNKQLKAARASNNTALVASLEAEVRPMRAAYKLANDNFVPIRKEWNRLRNEIKKFP